MLALLDSLLDAGFDTADQGRRALTWYDAGAYAPGGEVFDVGHSTIVALHALRSGVPAEEAGDVGAKGNGSLMRILPLPLVLRETPDAELLTLTCRAARVTHGSAEAQIACGLYVLCVRRLLRGEDDPAAVLAAARRTLRAELGANGLPGSKEAAEPDAAVAELDAFEAWSGRSGQGRVADSFWSAWDGFAAAPDYVSAVTAAVRYGTDTDTTAAIAGGLAGVRFGIEAVPSAWQRGLRDRGVAQSLVDRLVETDRSEWDGTPWRTSHTKALRVDFMNLAGTRVADGGGRAGMTFLPGKRYMGYYSGPHWRDLDSDAASLREQGVDVLLLLVEDKELVRCRATHVGDVLPEHGIELIRHPVRDPETPYDDAAYRRTISGLVERARGGATVAVACRGGLDRAGMTAACFLRESGLDADTAIARVHAARDHTLTMPEQLRYVKAWPHA